MLVARYLLVLSVVLPLTQGYNVVASPRRGMRLDATVEPTTAVVDQTTPVTSRRSLLTVSTVMLSMLATGPSNGPAHAAATTTPRPPLDELLYRIVRVREATQLEARLIRTGKFKDAQRANIKLAVRFMIENYRLNDAFVSASTYLDGTNRRLEATQVGQSAVQNLFTILEYFDSSDVENLKVGQSSLSGKEETVLKGLDATRRNIDDFLAYFPKADLEKVVDRVAEENSLNMKEFDPSLGSLLNMAPL